MVMKTEFTKWFKRQHFKNFSSQEFTSYFEVVRRGVANSYPPKGLWQNIIPTLRVLDDLRDHFGKPVVLLSSYRNDAYNKRCGGAKYSQHKYFTALDFAVVGHSPREVYTLLLKWRREGRFVGGLGLYNTFVHIDTRGHNATWGG